MQPRLSIPVIACLLCAALAAFPRNGRGAEPLRQQVDQFLAKKAAGQRVAGPAEDAEFLRRASLDFAGTIPTADEARSFLADKASDKRVKLLERLIAAPALGDRMAEVFHIQLMERLGDDEKWKAYLAESFRANKPWDVMVREMVNPDFRDEKTRAAGYFITRRLEKVGQQDTDYPGLTRDMGRLFMGVDLLLSTRNRSPAGLDWTLWQRSGRQPQIESSRNSPWRSMCGTRSSVRTAARGSMGRRRA